MSDLQSDLEQIDGIGSATSEKIIAVVEEHDQQSGWMERAKEQLEQGNERAALNAVKRHLRE